MPVNHTDRFHIFARTGEFAASSETIGGALSEARWLVGHDDADATILDVDTDAMVTVCRSPGGDDAAETRRGDLPVWVVTDHIASVVLHGAETCAMLTRADLPSHEEYLRLVGTVQALANLLHVYDVPDYVRPFVTGVHADIAAGR